MEIEEKEKEEKIKMMEQAAKAYWDKVKGKK